MARNASTIWPASIPAVCTTDPNFWSRRSTWVIPGSLRSITQIGQHRSRAASPSKKADGEALS